MERYGAYMYLVLLLMRACHAETYVRSTAELLRAFRDPAVGTVLLADSLVLNGSVWGPGAVQLNRSVTVSASPERIASRTYVLLDFNNLVMLFTVAPGMSIMFVGLELVNHFDTVGPTFRPLRQSVGGWVVFQECVQRRRAGLPYAAAVVNMAAATRPDNMTGTPQAVALVSNLSYASTRSPAAPLTYPQAVDMFDYATTTVTDSSLAFQGLFYGGYTYQTVRSYYAVDNFVQQSCLDQRPGSECVTLLLQQLDAARAAARVAPAPPAPAQPAVGGARGTPAATIVIASVVPAVALLAAAGAAAAVLLARRRARNAAYHSKGGPAPPGGPGGKQTPQSSQADLEAGKGGKAAAASSSCVFLGLDDQQEPPEWSQAAADQEAATHATEVGESSFHEQEQEQGRGQFLSHASEPRTAKAASVAVAPDTSRRGGGGQVSLRPAALSTATDLLNSSVVAGPSAAVGAGAAVVAVERPRDVLAELDEMSKRLRNGIRDKALVLEGIVGSGSFGTVYKGTWQGLSVAVKTVVFSASASHRRRALQEAALCQSITHPNVVATYTSDVEPILAAGSALSSSPEGTAAADAADGSGEVPNMGRVMEWRLYIVQEYCDGGPLRRLYGARHIWAGGGLVDMASILGIALGIARAVAHLHAKRIIHGDLNPNNVLLKRDAGEPCGFAVKVGDFGLSVMLPQHQTHLSNLRMGTMFYMCPAIVLKGQVGPSSDVFSLGVMLWELYQGRTAGVSTAEGPRYSSVFPSFPPACLPGYRAVALHCLQRHPQNRPPAAEVAERLEWLVTALGAAQPAPAAPPSVADGIAAWGRPGPVQ